MCLKIELKVRRAFNFISHIINVILKGLITLKIILIEKVLIINI